MNAARFRNAEIVEFLLKSEADVHAVDEGGKSVLMYALGKGTMPVIRMLLDNGASLESVTTQGQSIWDILVANRRADVWEHFAQEVIRLHKEDPNKSPLFQIITRGDMGFVDTLLKEGADINWSNPEGSSWLMLMAQHPSRSSSDLERFIRRGVNINAQDKKGDTALIYAIKNNAPVDKLEMLVRHGANVALSNQSGETALSLVRQMPRYAYLAQRWQGVVKDNALQDEPLRLAITRAEGKQRILQLMADEQDINRLDKNGKPVLLYLLEHDKDGELITALLERKVDLRVGVPEGMSVLDYAVQQGYSAVGIQILVRAGVKLKARNERGRDGLMIALFRRYEAPVIQALLDAGGDVEARDAEGRTPLIHAVRSYRYQHAELSLPVVQALFQAGASLEIRDNYGKSAVDYLQESGENKLLEAIVALK